MTETKQLKKRIQAQLKIVKPLLRRGLSKELMAEFNLSQGYIYDIFNGKTWSLEIGERILQIIDATKVFDIDNCHPVIEIDESLTPRQLKYQLRDEIKELKPLLKRGTPQAVAAQFDVPESMVYDLMEGRSWHLEVAIDLLKRCRVNKARAEFLELHLQEIIQEKIKGASK